MLQQPIYQFSPSVLRQPRWMGKKNTRKGGEPEADVDLMKQVFTMEEIRVICNSLEQSQHVLADNTPRDLLRKSLKAQISRH